MIGTCPECGAEVVEAQNEYVCRAKECAFKLRKTILGQPIDRIQVAKLLSTKRTDVLHGFISKSGKQFSANLALGADGIRSKVAFEFLERAEDDIVKPSSAAQEAKAAGQKLYDAGKLAEALPLLQSAAEAFPKDEILWQQLVIAARNTKDFDKAADFAKFSIKNFPRSNWLWMELGNVLTKMDRLDEAEKALTTAESINSEESWLWRYRVNLHQKTKNQAKVLQAWERLSTLVILDGDDLNRVGIAYYNQENYAKAVEFYRRAAAKTTSAHLYFNIGLAYANPKVSQDLDAADAYQQALHCEPTYEKASKSLEELKPKLQKVAPIARSMSADLFQSSDWFIHYLNPYEVLQIENNDGDAFASVKTIQRAKKHLLQEIELNDGKVSWLDDYVLDKSRALEMDDEILDGAKRAFHWEVFQNKPLLRFLTRGEIEHFLYSDAFSPRGSLELLDKEPAFRAFLSQRFAKQYNVILTRAIERRALPVIEVLFDGRRWVKPEDEDICFAGAHKRVTDLVQMMRAKAEEGVKRKVSLPEMEDFLQQHSLIHLFNLLPASFRTAQSEMVAEIRQLAVSCYNEHGDADLSRGILNLCKGFHFKNAELNRRLNEDFKIIETKIAEERKAEVRISFGAERPFHITKEGIRDGTKFFSANTIRDFRWGITVKGQVGAERYDYVLVVKNDSGEAIMANWTSSKADEGEQTKFFSSMVDACFTYLVESAIGKLQRRLQTGNDCVIGHCNLSQRGIAFQAQGLFFKKDRFIAWSDLSTETRNGSVILSSRSEPAITTTMAIKDIDNAVLIPVLRVLMEK